MTPIVSPSDLYVAVHNNVPVVCKRMSSATRLRIASGVAASCLLAALLTALQPYAEDWFNHRWQPVFRYHTSHDVAPPLTSEISGHIANWIQRKASRSVSSDLANLIVQEVFSVSTSAQIDPFLMLALILVESRFDYTATSEQGAVGLMQIVPKWHLNKIPSVQHLYDPKQSIRLGVKIFAEYKALQGNDVSKALLQYNGSLHLPGSQYHKRVLDARASLLTWLEQQLAATVNTK